MTASYWSYSLFRGESIDSPFPGAVAKAVVATAAPLGGNPPVDHEPRPSDDDRDDNILNHFHGLTLYEELSYLEHEHRQPEGHDRIGGHGIGRPLPGGFPGHGHD